MPTWHSCVVLIALLATSCAPSTAALVCSPGIVHVSTQERAVCCPSPATIQQAKTLLQGLGFVVLRASDGLIDSLLVDRAREDARVELDSMLTRLSKLGFNTDADSFSFDEVVHRSVRRYDLKLDRRRLAPSSTFHALSEAAAAWSKPVLDACGAHEQLEVAVEGVLTSLPGAPHQKFHQDGPLEGSYNCFIPLVDVGVQQSGTEFWPGSHAHPAVPQLVFSGAIGVDDAAQLATIVGDPSVQVVQPQLAAGDMLIYQYRVIHRGPANTTPFARPIFYCAWSDTAGAGDGYNFKSHRKVQDLERRQEIFGI